MDNIRCEICQVDVSGERNYQQHLEGKAHAKKKARYGDRLTNLVVASDTSVRPVTNVVTSYPTKCLELEPPERIERNSDTFCDVCSVQFTGPEPAAQHYASVKHKKKVEAAASKYQRNFPEKPYAENGDSQIYNFRSMLSATPMINERGSNSAATMFSKKSYTEVDLVQSEDFKIGEDDERFCKICQVSFTGREPAIQHYTGTKHKKKAETVRLARIDALPGLYCSECHIMCNTHQQLQIHRQSARHLEKATGLAGKPQPIIDNEDFDYTQESCELCGISTFTSSQHVVDHFSGKRHKQNEARQKMASNLSSENYCEHCKVLLTSEQQTIDHLNSVKHKSNEAKGRKAPEKSLPPVAIEEDERFKKKLMLTQKTPRIYQWELYQKAIEADSVIFLPTGTGKTLISAMVISHVLQQNPKRQIVFLVDRVLLVIQQSKVIKTELCHLKINDQDIQIAALCGEKQYTSSLPLHEHHILVTTAAYYINLLKDEIIRWEDLSLVVFDEAHHCTKSHPFNVILEEYYHVGRNKPRLLGLTASPAGQPTVQKTYYMLQQLLSNFGDAQLASVQDCKDELVRFKTQAEPVIKIVKLDRQESILDEELQMYLLKCYETLCGEIRHMKIFFNLRDVNEFNSEKLLEFLKAIGELQSLIDPEEKVYQFMSHVFVVGEVLESLRETGLEIAIAELKDVLKRDLKLAHENRIFLSNRLQKLLQGYAKGSNEMSGVHQLLNELNDHMNWENGIALILVKTRCTAHSVTEFLNQSEIVYNKYCEAVCLVGHGSGSKDGGMSVTKQGSTIRKIWDNKSTIVVATSVAEEGLDLPECDLVIVMDPPSTVTALVQIRGRARRRGAKFIVLCRDSGQRDSMHELLLREKNMEKAADKLNNKKSLAAIEQGYDPIFD